VNGTSASADGAGVYGYTAASGGTGVYGDAAASSGTSYGVHGKSSSSSGNGVYGEASAGSGTTYGVHGKSTSSSGAGVYGEATSGIGGRFANSSTSKPTLYVENALGGDLIYAYAGSTGRFRVDTSGNVYADGAYNCGPGINDDDASGDLSETEIEPCLKDDSGAADFAEMLPAEVALEPGDVLVVAADGTLARSSEPYQNTVVGIYSTRPSFLGNSSYFGQEGYAPLAVVGVVPVKASAENGAIRPGDMLTAASIAGHAMRAGDNPPVGTIVGKALAGLESGTGVILMLVMLQ
jgi:hypothetical protein